ncbi:uncharacterized protein [Physcomitrium patens]|uniref:uncharacterized protein isoform X2 n=1 Tax=Physcomitrium patens TaxID=3218 RepID=UPI003CCD954B
MEIEMLNQKQNNANGGISPLTIPKLALNTRFSDQVASPVEFRSKIQDRSLTNIINNSLAVNLPTAAQLFPQRRRSSAISGSANLMAGRAYKLVPEIGKKGRRESRFRQQPAKRSSSQQELQRGHGDNLLVSQKLDWIDLQMRSSEYLKNLRGFPRLSITTEEPLHMGRPQLGHKKRSTLVVDEGMGEAAVSFNRSTNMTNRLTFKRQVREGSVSRSSFTKPLVSTTATEERKRRGTAVEDRRAHQGSVVEVPLDPKHWLLQSLRLQDYELQELFDQMEDVTEMIPYDTAGVRNQLKELDGRKSEMPPDVKMLRKDQTLLDKVKNLITRYIEVQGKKRQDVEPPEADDEFREKTPALFEGFERNQEGNLLPVFTKGTSLCSLCGQARTKKLTRDSELSASPLLEPQSLMHALPSFIPIEDYVIYQSIVQLSGFQLWRDQRGLICGDMVVVGRDVSQSATRRNISPPSVLMRNDGTLSSFLHFSQERERT